jgi:hypothetical protein
MRVLVCGGRDYFNYERVEEVLDSLQPIDVIIQGGASGADNQAAHYAALHWMDCEEYPAHWEEHGKKAGYIRNKQMLEEGKPDLVIAFPGGKGTANMVKLAREAGVEVKEIV